MKLLKPAWLRSFRLPHCIFAIVLLIRLVVLTRLTASPFLLPARGDMHFYDEWARRILDGHLTGSLAFYGLPLYAYGLALIYKLAGYRPFLPGLLQACLEAGTATVIFQIGRVVFEQAADAGNPEEGFQSLQKVGLVLVIVGHGDFRIR